MSEKKKNKTHGHPIRVVAARTGIPQDLLRAWEKRYQAVVPGRSPTGRRLYTDDDVEKLRLLKRAIAGGRRIGDVASLSIEQLREMTVEDESEIAAPVSRIVGQGKTKDGFLDEALAALEELDQQRLKKTLSNAAVSLSGPDLRKQVLLPLLQTIGDRWQQGTLRILHEHLASAIVRSFVTTFGSGANRFSAAPKMIVTTPSGQRHELGALVASSMAEEHGWDVYYLGPDLPAEEIAAAVQQIKPKAIALSVVYKNGDLQVQEEFRKLAGYIDSKIPILVGGRAVTSFKPFFDELGIRCVEDMDLFMDELAMLSG